ncbi:uncharacterized protein LOC131148516 isoform X2 [Malania oleifera]|uniref:uncharacterized protein LOC131148516 isoform X2 n=1 Tax=Malania oleifera TaxID=397392 RepID=UPI0025AE2080|nr:uncharacterized protein LOC131148516 isoform X2 [Malania oleifera]
MILLEPPIIFTTPAKLSSRRPFLTSAAVRCSSITKPECSAKASFKCSCKKNGKSGDDFESFSVLVSDIPWDDGSTWSTMALYFFSLHIPLSFGALSLVARMLHQTILDLQTEALSLLVIETLELIGALLLLKCTAKPQFKLVSFFKVDKSSKERNWLMASAIGFGILILFVFLTSLLADIIIGPKEVNNPILKEILLSGNVSEIACFIVYCIVAPLLEETVYRGFLLTSIASKMKWQHAVVISSAIFSLGHFSDDLMPFSRGDVASVEFLMECLNLFSRCSGLTANNMKSSIYQAGIKQEDLEKILNLTSVNLGEYPFRYLGVSLQILGSLPVGIKIEFSSLWSSGESNSKPFERLDG